MEELYEVVLDRWQLKPDESDTVRWLERGSHELGKKLVEEAAESMMAAVHEPDDALATELSQVLYFVTCLMVRRGIQLDHVLSRL